MPFQIFLLLSSRIFLSPDQLDQFGKQHLTRIEGRLSAVDTSLATITANVNNIQERAHVWDTFQHHVTAWSDLMTSVDSKVDHMGRYGTCGPIKLPVVIKMLVLTKAAVKSD